MNADSQEANVRSFLSMTGKVNKGIRDTLNDPQRFMAYNNGIVVVAGEVNLGRISDGGTGILWLKGMQIVNGGQTTASIYFTKKKNPYIDLKRVRVPAKIIVLKSNDPIDGEELISDISKYANGQNSVRQSDLSANKPFHKERLQQDCAISSRPFRQREKSPRQIWRNSSMLGVRCLIPSALGRKKLRAIHGSD